MKQIEIRTLPRDVLSIREHGLLYLPRPYVVPGGRFNEMYGWDSYFIQVGLLRDGELERARDMVENFVYEILHYGTILNANRTYFLSRSQPPFLTRMILGVYEQTGDRPGCGARCRPSSDITGSGPPIRTPCPTWDCRDTSIEERVRRRRFWPTRRTRAAGRTTTARVSTIGPTTSTDYDEALYYDSGRDRLTDLFYKGDRSMRESGFDPSNRFGALNVDVIHYAPVCLNTLLYIMEDDAARIMETLGDAAAAGVWRGRAASRRDLINRLLWDEQAGLYYDYNVRTRRLRRYDFATTFYPLWAGIASPAQAARVRGNLAKFEAPGGLLTSTEVTGSQWDAPFGWAPLQMIAVAGLRRYGFHEDADRIAAKFVSLVAKEFDEHGTIVEKYDVRRRESDVAADITFGYSANQIGFGWTNGAVLDLLAGMRQTAVRARSRRAPGPAAAVGVQTCPTVRQTASRPSPSVFTESRSASRPRTRTSARTGSSASGRCRRTR